MSSITRAFTTRRVKQSVELANNKKDNVPQRSKTTKVGNFASVRSQISAPVELIHTTNMLSYNAPDIRPSDSSSKSTKSSDEECESPTTAASTPPTSPDIGSNETAKTYGPAPNHLSCYFVAPHPTPDQALPDVPPVPAIPKRSPSHTKKASYDAIARQRSVSALSREYERNLSNKSSMTFSRTSSASTAASTVSHNSISPNAKPPIPALPPVTYQPQKSTELVQHPFGRELAQVSEIAEDFGLKHNNLDPEEQALQSKGLKKYSAEEYLADLQDIFATYLSGDSPESEQPPAAMWI